MTLFIFELSDKINIPVKSEEITITEEKGEALNQKKKATLRDIAQICGCSVTSVIRAMKDSPTISVALREKVQKTAEELGYINNAVASSMRTGNTNTIAVCLQDFSNPYYSSIAKYAEKYAREMGYSIIYATTNELPFVEYKACMKLIEKNVDGILLLPIQKDFRAIELLQKQQMPFVLVGRRFMDHDTDYVVSDDVKAAYIATKHLIERGASKILYINAPSYISSSRERLQGYKKALAEHDLESYVMEGSMEYGQTKKMVKEQLSYFKEFDALFTFCDIMAFETYNALTSLGVRIPSDLKLISIDGLQEDISLPCNITSIGVNRKEIVKESFNLLLNKCKGVNTPEPAHIILEPYLLQGDTT